MTAKARNRTIVNKATRTSARSGVKIASLRCRTSLPVMDVVNPLKAMAGEVELRRGHPPQARADDLVAQLSLQRDKARVGAFVGEHELQCRIHPIGSWLGREREAPAARVVLHIEP